MVAVKIYGHPFSTATRRVLATLYEKNLSFEFVHVELQEGVHKKEPFITLNPFGQVPALQDGDFKLFESRAITQYLAQRNPSKGNQLLNPGFKNMATMSVWMEVEAHQFDPPASKLVWEQVLKAIYGLQKDPEIIKENEAKLAEVLDVYEVRLSQSTYLASDSFTLADLHHLPNIQYLLETPTKKLFDKRPNVKAWVADITGRSAWLNVLQ